MGKDKKDALYSAQPEYSAKFRPARVREIIKEVLESKLQSEKYATEQTGAQSKLVADEIKEQLKELKLARYKIIVEVVIGEHKGQGVHKGTRSFWDPDTDAFAYYKFVNQHLFCVAAAYGIYHY